MATLIIIFKKIPRVSDSVDFPGNVCRDSADGADTCAVPEELNFLDIKTELL